MYIEYQDVLISKRFLPLDVVIIHNLDIIAITALIIIIITIAMLIF